MYFLFEGVAAFCRRILLRYIIHVPVQRYSGSQHPPHPSTSNKWWTVLERLALASFSCGGGFGEGGSSVISLFIIFFALKINDFTNIRVSLPLQNREEF